MVKFRPEKNEKTVISIRIDTSTLKNIDDLAQTTGISRNECITQCIDFALKNIDMDK